MVILNKSMVVYKITNLVNNKAYVGQTIQKLAQRRREHLSLKGYKGSHLLNAIKKYGRNNFSVEVLEECSSIEQLDEREAHWIAKLGTTDRTKGYNIAEGGHRVVLSEESRKKISNSLKGRPMLATTKDALRKANLGRKLSKEHIENTKRGLKGRKLSSEHRKSISVRMKGKKPDREATRRSAEKRKKPIVCLNDGKVYRSAIDAASSLNIRPQHIQRVLYGSRKSVHGLTFAFSGG